MSLIELKLTILEDYCKKNEDRWHSEYIKEHWKLDMKAIYKNIFNEDVEFTYKNGKVQKLKPLKNKGKLPLVHGVGKKI